MKKLFAAIIIVSLMALSGCVSYPTGIADLLAINRSDLEKAKKDGKTITMDISTDKAFQKTMDIIRSNDLVVFQQDKDKKYIIVMGFKKQTDTTRVGIFFDSDGNNTTVTVSSLSGTCLAQAEKIILGGLKSK